MATATPSERRRYREAMLIALYEATNGDTRRWRVNSRELWATGISVGGRDLGGSPRLQLDEKGELSA